MKIAFLVCFIIGTTTSNPVEREKRRAFQQICLTSSDCEALNHQCVRRNGEGYGQCMSQASSNYVLNAEDHSNDNTYLSIPKSMNTDDLKNTEAIESERRKRSAGVSPDKDIHGPSGLETDVDDPEHVRHSVHDLQQADVPCSGSDCNVISGQNDDDVIVEKRDMSQEKPGVRFPREASSVLQNLKSYDTKPELDYNEQIVVPANAMAILDKGGFTGVNLKKRDVDDDGDDDYDNDDDNNNQDIEIDEEDDDEDDVGDDSDGPDDEVSEDNGMIGNYLKNLLRGKRDVKDILEKNVVNGDFKRSKRHDYDDNYGGGDYGDYGEYRDKKSFEDTDQTEIELNSILDSLNRKKRDLTTDTNDEQHREKRDVFDAIGQSSTLIRHKKNTVDDITDMLNDLNDEIDDDNDDAMDDDEEAEDDGEEGDDDDDDSDEEAEIEEEEGHLERIKRNYDDTDDDDEGGDDDDDDDDDDDEDYDVDEYDNSDDSELYSLLSRRRRSVDSSAGGQATSAISIKKRQVGDDYEDDGDYNDDDDDYNDDDGDDDNDDGDKEEKDYEEDVSDLVSLLTREKRSIDSKTSEERQPIAKRQYDYINDGDLEYVSNNLVSKLSRKKRQTGDDYEDDDEDDDDDDDEGDDERDVDDDDENSDDDDEDEDDDDLEEGSSPIDDSDLLSLLSRNKRSVNNYDYEYGENGEELGLYADDLISSRKKRNVDEGDSNFNRQKREAAKASGEAVSRQRRRLRNYDDYYDSDDYEYTDYYDDKTAPLRQPIFPQMTDSLPRVNGPFPQNRGPLPHSNRPRLKHRRKKPSLPVAPGMNWLQLTGTTASVTTPSPGNVTEPQKQKRSFNDRQDYEDNLGVDVSAYDEILTPNDYDDQILLPRDTYQGYAQINPPASILEQTNNENPNTNNLLGSDIRVNPVDSDNKGEMGRVPTQMNPPVFGLTGAENIKPPQTNLPEVELPEVSLVGPELAGEEMRDINPVPVKKQLAKAILNILHKRKERLRRKRRSLGFKLEYDAVGKDGNNRGFYKGAEVLEETDEDANKGYEAWSSWSECSKTCDVGIQERFRKCDDVTHCYSGDSEMHPCFLQPC